MLVRDVDDFIAKCQQLFDEDPGHARLLFRYKKRTGVALFRATNDKVCHAFRATGAADHEAIKRVLKAAGELLPCTPGIDYAVEDPRPGRKKGKKGRH